MSTRPTIKQMTEAMKGASDVGLNTLLDVVLGACCARGFLPRKLADIVLKHVCAGVYEADPVAAMREVERLASELDELEGQTR